MTDNQTTVEQLKQLFKKFVEQRGWDRLNSPKDLSMDIVSEATELMNLFLYVDEKELLNRLKIERKAVEHEIADIAFALLNFCSMFDIDLSKAIEHKMIYNALKYPLKK